MENEAQSRILNIPEILARVWKRKVVFLLSFLLVLAVGCGWVFTKPEEQTAKQLLVFKFPETTAESQATQQAAMLPALDHLHGSAEAPVGRRSDPGEAPRRSESPGTHRARDFRDPEPHQRLAVRHGPGPGQGRGLAA